MTIGRTKSFSKMKADSQMVTVTPVDELSDMNLCCICFERPMQVVLDCHHSYCEKCAEGWQEKSTECPLCRKEIKRDEFYLIAGELDEDFLQRREYLQGEVAKILQ